MKTWPKQQSRLSFQRPKRRKIGKEEQRQGSQCSTWISSRMSSGRGDHGCYRISLGRYPRSLKTQVYFLSVLMQRHDLNARYQNANAHTTVQGQGCASLSAASSFEVSTMMVLPKPFVPFPSVASFVVFVPFVPPLSLPCLRARPPL